MDDLLKLISSLPLPAVLVFAAVLAVIIGVRYLGLGQGLKSGPSNSVSSATVAAVIVDPSALNRASAALEASNVTQMEANGIARKQATSTDRLAKVIEDLTDGVSDLRDEVIRSAAKMK